MSSNIEKPTVIVILGPTASGKSAYAIELAKKENGEIISADSRQIYKGLDIGTGKVTKEEMQGIPHHLLDIKNPDEKYSATEWKADAEKAIEDILKRNKTPIICGGTGYYIDALIKNNEYPDAPELDVVPELPPGLDIDYKNPRKVKRAAELIAHYGHIPPVISKESPYTFKLIGIDRPDLRERIEKRFLARMEAGMINEARLLHTNGLSFERMDELGLEYRYLAQYLKKEITKDELLKILPTKIWQYARRQRTWFRRDHGIEWIKN
jgi:tRNA dimethylallyltransferase